MSRRPGAGAITDRDTKDRELRAARVFSAPQELVWRMWSDPERIARWWGPRGFTTTTRDWRFEVGGDWRFVMHGPDGTDYKNHIVFLEIVPPSRLVFEHVPEAGTEPVSHETTVTLEARDGKTLLTMRILFASANQRAYVVKTYGADLGLHQTLNRLVEQVEQATTGRFVPRRELVLTRTFDAPRAQVFRAWTDPQQVARWFGPKGFTNPVCSLDARSGGAINIVMRAPDGTDYPCGGHFEEIVDPEHLVFYTTAAFDGSGQPSLVNLNIATFEEEGGRTTLTLRVIVVEATPAALGPLSGMEQGWSQSLDKLVALFG